MKPRLKGLPSVGHKTAYAGLGSSVATYFAEPRLALCSPRRRALRLRASATLRRGFSRQSHADTHERLDTTATAMA